VGQSFALVLVGGVRDLALVLSYPSPSGGCRQCRLCTTASRSRSATCLREDVSQVSPAQPTSRSAIPKSVHLILRSLPKSGSRKLAMLVHEGVP
jgi:hypothetical protein